MKNKMTNKIKLLALLMGILVIAASCEYQEVTDAEYPDQLLYMPAAVNGLFTIDKLPVDPEFIPTPGSTYQFIVDEANGKFIVPLSVYRSGLERKSDITVDLTVQNDTISNLIQASTISSSTIILSPNKYTLPSSVVVKDGCELEKFNLEIDLDYLKGIPNGIVGVAVSISSSKVEVNEKYRTTVIIIHTKILTP